MDGQDVDGHRGSAQEGQPVQVTVEDDGSDLLPWAVGIGSVVVVVAAIVAMVALGVRSAGRRGR